MKEYIFRIDKKNIDALGPVRCIQGLLVATGETHIWLRGISENQLQQHQLLQLPIQHTYLLEADNLLFIPGKSTPVAILPLMQWQPLHHFLPLQLPVAALPGRMPPQVPLQLVACAKTKPGAALLTSLAHWKKYAATAPAARLQLLRFAVSEKSEVLIMGNPLPPLPGREYWMHDQVLLPGGYDFAFPLAASFIHKKIDTNGSAVVLFNEDGTYQLIETNFFVPAKRSAVRLTKEPAQHD